MLLRSLQAASLFGLESVNPELIRKQGYSFCKSQTDAANNSITVWPRQSIRLAPGGLRLAPDQSQNLTEENFFSWPLSKTRSGSPAQPASVAEASFDPSSDLAANPNLAKARYHLPIAPAHLAIRQIERTETLAALVGGSVLWISAEWGTGEDGFLGSVLQDYPLKKVGVYRLDLSDYTNRSAFFSEIRSLFGMSFENLCELISREKDSLLLLDNIPSGLGRANGQRSVESDLEELATVLRTYAPNCKVVLRGRPDRNNTMVPVISLRPLDEPDVVDYLRAHPLGGVELTSPDIAAKIWRASGGAPPRIDTMLRELEVTSLDDLLSSNAEFVGEIASPDAPTALISSIESLKCSETPLHKRVFHLLEALSTFPRGEQLERIKRFYGPNPIWPSHAVELTDRRLVETTPIVSGVVTGSTSTSKILSVPRIAREYVRNQMPETRRHELDGLAMTLYFGDAWRSGDIAGSSAEKNCKEPLVDPYEIINATALIHRFLVEASVDGDGDRLFHAVVLSSSFVEVLLKGDHYLYAAQLCEQVLSVLPTVGNEQQVDVLHYLQGRALRMIGRRVQAKEALLKANPASLSASQKRLLNLNLAMAFEGERDAANARKYAKAVLEKNQNDGWGIQAKQILAAQIADKGKRLTRLRSLERSAVTADSLIAANNVRLAIASLTDDLDKKASVLESILDSGGNETDFYNSIRAIIGIMEAYEHKEQPTSDQVIMLVDSYQHLYNERAENLFDRCHKALWNVFARKKEKANLFRLFRYSSFAWRLRGEGDKELEYLTDLRDLEKTLSDKQRLEVTREIEYFRLRDSGQSVREGGGLLPAK